MTNAVIQRIWRLDPEWGRAPWRSAPACSERVLHVHLATEAEPQTSLCRALASLGGDGGYRRVDWTSLSGTRRDDAVLAAARVHRPTLVFMQLQRPGVLAPRTVALLRELRGTNGVLVSWCGDVGDSNGPCPAPDDGWARELSSYCDLMLYTSLSQVRAHRSRGMHNAAYLQIGYDEDRYFEGPEAEYGANYAVSFIGTCYQDQRWSSLPTHEAHLRRVVADRMRRRFGRRFGLFGVGWGRGVAEVAPAQSGDVYRRSDVALSISLCSDLERYSSDRLLRALACGTPTLVKTFSDWGSFGCRHGINVLGWNRPEEAVSLAETWLRPEHRDGLRELGRRGAALTREHHSWGIRMRELMPLIAAVRDIRLEQTRPW